MKLCRSIPSSTKTALDKTSIAVIGTTLTMPADAEGKEESKSDQATTEMDSTSDVKEEGRKSQAGNDAVKDDEGEKTKDDDKSNGKESAGKADKETSGEDDNTELPGKEVDKKEDRDDATKRKEPAVKSDKEPSTETVAKEVIKEKVEGDVTKVKDQKDNGVKKEGVVGELPKTEGNDSEIKKDKVTEGKKRKSKFVETLAPIKREKRDRKSADAFKPDDFAKVDRSVNIADGRGVPLAKLDVCKNSIEKEPANSEVIALAHKLLFTVRGRPNKKDMKKNILMFSGFFSASKDPDKAKQEKLDLHEEVSSVDAMVNLPYRLS